MSKSHFYAIPIVTSLLGLSILSIGNVQAGQYTGNSPACTRAMSNSTTTCSIDLLDFMKNKSDHVFNGVRFTMDSTNLNAPANSQASSSFKTWTRRYLYKLDKDSADDWNPNDAANLGRSIYMQHPSSPNLLLYSSSYTNNPAAAIAYSRWGGNEDNSLYVLSEAGQYRGPEHQLYKSFGQAYDPTLKNWRNRGYIWFDKKFDISLVNGKGILAPRPKADSYYDVFADGLPGSPLPEGGMIKQNSDDSKGSEFIEASYDANSSDTLINKPSPIMTSMIPNVPLEVLTITHGTRKDGKVTWFEKYFYARQQLADGSYNSFGLIRFIDTFPTNSLDGKLGFDFFNFKCTGGVLPTIPTSDEAKKILPNNLQSARCDESGLILKEDTAYNGFKLANSYVVEENFPTSYPTVKSWMDAALSPQNKWKNDVKITTRVVQGTLDPDSKSLPHNRGGFVPFGVGTDSKNTTFSGKAIGQVSQPNDWLFLENSTVDQDWYIYPNGKDPLFATGPSPTNFCRDGYRILGSMAVTESYNGLTGEFHKPSGLHWVLLCGTNDNAYLQTSNPGEKSCNDGYSIRTFFQNFNHYGVYTCTPGQGCVDASAKNYVNFCVKTNECAAGMCMSSPNP